MTCWHLGLVKTAGPLETRKPQQRTVTKNISLWYTPRTHTQETEVGDHEIKASLCERKTSFGHTAYVLKVSFVHVTRMTSFVFISY